MELFKLVVVFKENLKEEVFTKFEHSLLEYMDAVGCKLHEVKGFGNTKVKQGDKTIYGWCDYIYFTAEKENTDKVYRSLRSRSFITDFQFIILKGKAKDKIDTSSILDVNNLQKINTKDYFKLVFDC